MDFKQPRRAKLSIGASNDPLELEADRVADQVMTATSRSAVNGAPPRIQCHTEQATEGSDTAPASVHSVLSNSGRPLEPSLRQNMEQRFGYDFSRVRVHSGVTAERSVQDVSANAYTVGNHIVFGAAQFSPDSQSGRRLLAHELTHVVQQGAEVSTLRAQRKKQASSTKAKTKKPEVCGRPSRKVAGNAITRVNLDVGANTLTIDWKDPTKIPPGGVGTHSISPGSGLCCVDCNDETVSQTTGSLCTPKGGEWPVDRTDCKLSGHPTAKNPTYFQRGGVAIHSGETSAPPRSHGCARTSLEISELIHDNVVPEVTRIASSGTWAGTGCYLNEASKELSSRQDVCDGNKVKSKSENKKAKGKPKQPSRPNVPKDIPTQQTPKPVPPSAPVAQTLPIRSNEFATAEGFESDTEVQPELAADGPGPNNESLSHESIGEIPIADLDLIGDTGDAGDEAVKV